MAQSTHAHARVPRTSSASSDGLQLTAADAADAQLEQSIARLDKRGRDVFDIMAEHPKALSSAAVLSHQLTAAHNVRCSDRDIAAVLSDLEKKHKLVVLVRASGLERYRLADHVARHFEAKMLAARLEQLAKKKSVATTQGERSAAVAPTAAAAANVKVQRCAAAGAATAAVNERTLKSHALKPSTYSVSRAMSAEDRNQRQKEYMQQRMANEEAVLRALVGDNGSEVGTFWGFAQLQMKSNVPPNILSGILHTNSKGRVIHRLGDNMNVVITWRPSHERNRDWCAQHLASPPRPAAAAATHTPTALSSGAVSPTRGKRVNTEIYDASQQQ